MQGSKQLLMKYGGSTALTALPSRFMQTVDTASTSIEARNPQIVEAKIQGAHPHQSAKDKNDKKPVITVSYHTERGTRIMTIHAHDDGTWTEFPRSR
ncbi:hypothetical protein K461DRAFT_281327 [Myriangium duriaei CBS 260.36]|uniref:Uncharacterized protein n=1 Tax=Myriangium duriaei CBS 260.36 TaxID=1168546 RepID=A0A9P4IU87_9PEZI|nr:hypothetical protein K461DRAFT_281327 [Myriangium duriaei CBS 260.36]